MSCYGGCPPSSPPRIGRLLANHQTPRPASHPERLITHISVPRWSTYLSAARERPILALELYEWNLHLSAAAHTVLAVVEVALRNAIDRSLRAWNQTEGAFPAEWTLAPCREIEHVTRSGRDLTDAKLRAQRSLGKGRPVAHDDVLAHLTFGTWRYMLPTSTGDVRRNRAVPRSLRATGANAGVSPLALRPGDVGSGHPGSTPAPQPHIPSRATPSAKSGQPPRGSASSTRRDRCRPTALA